LGRCADFRTFFIAALLLMVFAWTGSLHAQSRDTVVLRGHPQEIRVYGVRGSGNPVIVSSGDGGWVHLAPHVAEVLAARGFFVVGFDAKAYLESFTSASSTLRPEDEPGDFRTLVAYASRGSSHKPILIGVSEGAGLSVLAAAHPEMKKEIAGVIGLGLPDMNELGWRWRDAVIYLTHGAPNEPMFSAAAIVSNVAPLPLAAIHSTNDEFVPVSEVERVLMAAKEPKKLWVVKAANHRFSDNIAEFDQRLLDAIEWLKGHQPG
jgi:alpha-beta hydrolase superfamily lysophospholipase